MKEFSAIIGDVMEKYTKESNCLPLEISPRQIETRFYFTYNYTDLEEQY